MVGADLVARIEVQASLVCHKWSTGLDLTVIWVVPLMDRTMVSVVQLVFLALSMAEGVFYRCQTEFASQLDDSRLCICATTLVREQVEAQVTQAAVGRVEYL